MSKAFTKEDEGNNPAVGRPRSTMGEGPRPITLRGFQRLKAELDSLEAERRKLKGAPSVEAAGALAKLSERESYLSGVLAQAVPQDPLDGPPEQVIFGARVRVRDSEDRETDYWIVGPDEVDARNGRISVQAPLAQSLLGRRIGDSVTFERPRGDTELLVVELGAT